MGGKTGFGQATLTIPGTNIQIPLNNTMGNVVTSQPGHSTAGQTQQNSGPAINTSHQHSHAATNTVSATTTTTTAQQQQTNHQHHQHQQPATMTIPGTNIQIPTSMANGMLSQLQNVKIEGAGKSI